MVLAGAGVLNVTMIALACRQPRKQHAATNDLTVGLTCVKVTATVMGGPGDGSVRNLGSHNICGLG